MKYKYALLVPLTLIVMLAGCRINNYAVPRDISPIPYKNQYSSDDEKSHEFTSTLYHNNSDWPKDALVELSHLQNDYNRREKDLEGTWKKSKLTFRVRAESGIEIVPGSVTLQHYSTNNELIEPLMTESTLSECLNIKGCLASLVLHYKKGLPTNIVEKVSFDIIIDDSKETISYIIPLTYTFDRTVWGLFSSQ